jgi:nucleotide-binding universal stress UspA family protein
MIQMKKILCPIDFSANSLRAFNYAVQLAENQGAAVHALHVVAPVVVAELGQAIPTNDLYDRLMAQSRKELQKLSLKARRSKLKLETEVRVGVIDVEILRAVRKAKADVLVMGTHGRRGLEKWILGSVTERLMRHCPIPLLAVPPKATGSGTRLDIRNILVTTDFSEGTTDTMAYAFSIAQESQSNVTLLHVISDRSQSVTLLDGEPPQNTGKLRSTSINGIRRRLEEFVPEQARLWCKVNVKVDAGTPYSVILKNIKAGRFGLVVMNLHGKGLVERALIGSTAERVVRAAECPVLLIPPMRSARPKVGRHRKSAA